jgi:hypothetical protein
MIIADYAREIIVEIISLTRPFSDVSHILVPVLLD